MTAKRPLVVGPRVGGDTTSLDELVDDLAIEPGTSVVDTLGVDRIEAARFQEESIRSPGTRLLAVATEPTGSTYVRANTDTSWCNLPEGRFEYPSLLKNVFAQCQITAAYFNSDPFPGQTIEFEMLINSVPTGDVLSWNIVDLAGSPSLFILNLTLQAIHGADPSFFGTLYFLDGRLRIQEGHTGNDALVVDQERQCRPVIDGTASLNLGFRFRRTLATAGEALLVKSVSTWDVVYRSGS